MPSITGLSLLNAGHLSVRRVSAQTSLRAMGPLAACTRLCTFISFPPIQVRNSNAAGSGPPAALTEDPAALRLQQLAGQSEQYAHRYSAEFSQRHLTIKVEVEEYASAEYWTKMLALHPPPHRAVGHAQPRSQPRSHRRDALARAGERHDLGPLHQPRRCGARARAARPPSSAVNRRTLSTATGMGMGCLLQDCPSPLHVTCRMLHLAATGHLHDLVQLGFGRRGRLPGGALARPDLGELRLVDRFQVFCPRRGRDRHRLVFGLAL